MVFICVLGGGGGGEQVCSSLFFIARKYEWLLTLQIEIFPIDKTSSHPKSHILQKQPGG